MCPIHGMELEREWTSFEMALVSLPRTESPRWCNARQKWWCPEDAAIRNRTTRPVQPPNSECSRGKEAVSCFNSHPMNLTQSSNDTSSQSVSSHRTVCGLLKGQFHRLIENIAISDSGNRVQYDLQRKHHFVRDNLYKYRIRDNLSAWLSTGGWLRYEVWVYLIFLPHWLSI